MSRTGHCRSAERAVHPAAGGRNASCRLPGALLAEQAKVLLFLPRSAQLTFRLQTHSTDRYRKALWSGILRCCIPGNQGKGMRAEKQQTQAEKEKRHCPRQYLTQPQALLLMLLVPEGFQDTKR